MPTVLITAGGTVEPIDGVRGITNFSSGRLGSIIAKLFLEQGWDVVFLRGKSTPTLASQIAPSSEESLRYQGWDVVFSSDKTLTTLGAKSSRLSEVLCSDTESVSEALKFVAKSKQVDVVIHSMAISDYTVAGVTDLDTITNLSGQAESLTPEAVRNIVLTATNQTKQGKVSSSLKRPLLLLQQTPKLISGLRDLFPKAVLVGFKLLNGASPQALRDAAMQSIRNNRLDFVVANDLTSVQGEKHVATLYSADLSVTAPRALTKTSIAEMVFHTVAPHISGGAGSTAKNQTNIPKAKFDSKKVLLIVTGSIAAYKAVDVANALRNKGHSVKVVLTEAAQRFIPLITFKGQGFETYTDSEEWAWKSAGVLHIDLSRNWADVILVAPATANTLAKMQHGITDNLATSCIRAFTGRVVVAPAMNTGMYENSADVITALVKRGVHIVEPVSKRLACGEIGNGGLAPTADIVQGVETTG